MYSETPKQQFQNNMLCLFDKFLHYAFSITRLYTRMPASCTGLVSHTQCLLPWHVCVVLGNFFGARLSVVTLESSIGNNYGILWGVTLRLCSNIDELLWRTLALGSSFRKQLWGAVFGNNFMGELWQLWGGAALVNNFGERLWGTAL